MSTKRACLVLCTVLLVGAIAVSAKGPAWSETPTLKDVPADGVRGEIDGKAFEFPNITIEGADRGWALEFRSGADYMSPGPRVETRDDLAAGKTVTRKMGTGHGGAFLQKPDAKDPGRTFSLNTDVAMVLEITAWNVAPYGPATKGKPAGTASGRIALAFKDDGKSWAAGTFKDVPVKFAYAPPLCALSCVRLELYDPGKTVAKASATAAGKPVKLAWTEKPALEMASEPLAAELDGKAVTLDDLSVVGQDKAWVVSFQGHAGDLTVGTAIKLAQRPVKGARFAKPMGDGGNISLDVPDKADAANTASFPGPAAYVLEFTAFEAKPWDESMRNVTTDVGKASGRIVAMFKGAEGYANSWVAGTFTDVPVQIYREPPLCAVTCAAP